MFFIYDNVHKNSLMDITTFSMCVDWVGGFDFLNSRYIKFIIKGIFNYSNLSHNLDMYFS